MNSVSAPSSASPVPAFDDLAAVSIPIQKSFRDAESTATSWNWTGGLLALCVVLAGAFYGASGDSWLITRVVLFVFFGALACIPAGILFAIVGQIGSSAFRQAHPEMRATLETAVRDAFGGQPSMSYDFIPSIKEARIYAFDSQARHLYLMRAKSTGDEWQVLRIPMSIVRRMELLTKTNSTTRATTSGNQINVTTETSSSYGIRVHYIDKSGVPGMDVLHFRDNEPLAQTWLTALGG